jgi:hypothetical protein
MARRLGIMYIIWDHRIWTAQSGTEGWRRYTGRNQHVDHVHFSFGWPGARADTSFWTGRVARTPGPITLPSLAASALAPLPGEPGVVPQLGVVASTGPVAGRPVSSGSPYRSGGPGAESLATAALSGATRPIQGWRSSSGTRAPPSSSCRPGWGSTLTGSWDPRHTTGSRRSSRPTGWNPTASWEKALGRRC